MSRVKICCIQNLEEAGLAIRLGADALGLVSAMPSGPGPIADEAIAEIAQRTPPAVSTFLLTSRTGPEDVVRHVLSCRTSVVQLVDRVPEATYQGLRRSCPNVRIVQVVHVEGEDAMEEARRVSAHVDGVLLDSGRPGATVKELGGTGRVHDWALSRRIIEELAVPVFLAGGLNPSNVSDAIRQARPYGVDLCSGVRTDGRLDERKLADFLAAVRRIDTARG